MTDTVPAREGRPRPESIGAAPVTIAAVAGCCAAVGILATGVHWAVAVAVGGMAAVLLLVPIRGRGAADRLRHRFAARKRSTPRVSTFAWTTVDGGVIGVHRDRRRMSAVVEILPRAGGFTTISTAGCLPDRRMPLTVLAECLHRGDITLDGIDIISHGRRSDPATEAGEIYRHLIGDLPVAAERSVWVVLTLDIPSNRRAIARRGDRGLGAPRALAVTADRVVAALSAHNLRSRILTAAELDSVSVQIAGRAGASERVVPRTRTARVLLPRAITSDDLTRIWGLPGDETTCTLRLRPGPTGDRCRVGAGYLFNNEDVGRPRTPSGALPMRSADPAALFSHLPATATAYDSTLPFGEFPGSALADLALPAGADGQLIGSDADGAGVTARIFGRGVARTYVAGELFVALQLAFRAMAIGGRLMVVTERENEWRRLAAAVPENRLTIVSGRSRPAGGLTRFDAVILDGTYAIPPETSATVVHVADDAAFWPVDDPDVTIVQPIFGDDRVILTAGTRAVRLTLVTIPEETRFTGGLHARVG